MVEHSSVQPDGRPTYRGTRGDQMMQVSLSIEYVILMGHVEECTTSTKGMSFSYICTDSQMAHAGNNVLIVYDRILAYN